MPDLTPRPFPLPDRFLDQLGYARTVEAFDSPAMRARIADLLRRQGIDAAQAALTGPRRYVMLQGAIERGVHLIGEQDWRNYSRWADKSAEPPGRGARACAWRSTTAATSVRLSSSMSRRRLRQHQQRAIARSAAWRCAKPRAVFCAGNAVSSDVSGQDVLNLADAWLRWAHQEQ